MKKNYFKKSLSLIMTVVMLMTCWVFVAPTEADAASSSAQLVTNYANGISSAVNSNVNVDTTSNYYQFRVAGNGDNSSNNTTARQQKYYKNILAHSGNVTSTSTGVTFSGVTNSEYTFSIMYPNMVLKYDGSTNPRFGIMLQGDSASGKKIRFERAWITSGAENFTFNPAYWAGIANDDSAFFYIMEDSAKKYLYAQDTNTGDKFDARKNGQWEFLATSLEFTGNMPLGTWVKALKPEWSFFNGSTTYVGTTNSTIYVMNFKGYNDVLADIRTTKQSILNEPGKYTPASVKAYADAANAIANLSPANNYGLDKVAAWGNSMTTAYNNYTAAKNALKARDYEILYENLFSLTDWYYSDSSRNGDANITTDVHNGTVTINNPTTDSSTEYTTHSNTGAHTATAHKIDVTGGKTYTFRWKVSGGTSTEVFFMWKNSSGAAIQGPNSSGAYVNYPSVYFSGDGYKTAEFVAPADATMVELRFDNNTDGTKVTFSDIAVYDKANSADLISANTAPASTVYAYGNVIGQELPVPTRTGYTFKGWYLDSNNNYTYDSGDTLIADGSGTVTTTDLQNFAITENWTLRSLWEINKYTVTYIFVDSRGTVTETYTHGDALNIPTASKPANSNANQHFSVAWDKAFVTPVTESITYKEIQTAGNHSWGAWSTVKAATCTEAGTQERFCTVCNYRQEGTIAAKGHTYVSHAAVANDCGNAGNKAYYTCSVAECNGLYFLEKNGVAVDYNTEIYLAATGEHLYKPVAGTSTGNKEDDKHTVECSVCGHTVEGRNHVWKSKTTAGDCVTETVITFTCECGATRTETQGVNPDKHKGPYKTGVDKAAATCTDDGYTGDKVCTACNAVTVKGEVIPKLGHSFTNYVYQNDATCFADGNEIAKCDRCDETHTRTAEGTQLTHKYNDEDYAYNNDATCGVDGTETALCANGCGTKDTRTAVGSARAHKFDGAVKNNEDGTHSFECSYDDCDVYSEGIPCSAWAEDATAGKCKCTVCGYTKAHAWGDEWYGSADNGNAAGTMYRVCADCNAKEEATPCVYTSVHKDATCLAPEITTYTCKDCGHGYTVIGQPALGHDFNGGTVKSFNNGYHAYMCIRGCEVHGVDKTVSAVEDCAYDYENTGSGTHKATCTVCNYSFNDNCSGGIATCTDQAVCQYCNTKYGTTSDHVYTGTEKYLYKATEATCIANETYYFYCLGCEQTIDGVGTYEKPDTMLPHDYTCDDETLYLATYAECGVDATYYYYCSNTDCKKSSEGTDKQATFADAGSALNHEFGGAATSNNNGTHTLECQQTNPAGFDCKATADYNCADTAKLEAVNSATCTEAGYNEYICQLCDYEWTTVTDAALGHEYTEQIKDDAHFISAADCENGTVYWYDCAYCDKNAKDEDDASYTDLTYELDDSLGHNFGTNVTENGVATPATCTSAAKYYYACSRCSELDKTRTFFSGESLGHHWAEIEAEEYIAVKPDCVTDAKYYKVCDRTDCGVKSTETWTKENSKSGHSLTHTAAKAANCDEAGNHAYWYCSTCKIYFKNAEATEAFTGEDATIIKKRAHDKVAVSFKNPTCLEDGHPAYEYCKYEDCNYTTLPEVLDNAYKAKGHNFAGVLVYDADLDCHSWMCLNGCGAKGMIVDGAQVEFKVEGNTYVGAVACEFTNYVAKTTDGIHSHALTCECGNESSKIYTDDETKIETVAATCTEDGYDAHVCPDCKATWKKNIVKSEGHKWSDNYVSNGDGTHSRVCSACNDSKETARCSGGEATCLLPAVCEFCKTGYGSTVDHKYTGEWTYVEGSAKCGVDGKETNACDVCKTPVERTAVGTALDHKMSSFGYADILPEGWDAPDFDESELKAPTCKDFGLTISYCENEDCGYYETRLVYPDETLHTWGDEYPVGDCSTGVSIMQECTKCGIKKTLRVETDEHDWKEILNKAPTCEANGYMHFKCSKCNFVAIVDDVNYNFEQDTIELGKVTIDVASLLAKGHTWGDEIVDKAPTCGLTGRAHKICSTCQKVYEYKLDATGNHTLTTVSGCPATCDSNGFESYKDCIVCSYSETAKVIPAKGHADNDGNGKCDGCNDSMDDILAKKDGCICHKNNGFMKFIYSILRFFWKLFKINKTCACGAAHY